jgi:hypothetical protein
MVQDKQVKNKKILLVHIIRPGDAKEINGPVVLCFKKRSEN